MLILRDKAAGTEKLALGDMGLNLTGILSFIVISDIVSTLILQK